MCQATTGGNNPTKLHSCETLHCSGFVLSYLTGTTSSVRNFSLKSTILTRLSFFLSPAHRLLHLAIIHEASEHALHMIKQSHNHPFLDAQNHQRQVRASTRPLMVGSVHAFLVSFTVKLTCAPTVPHTDCPPPRGHHRAAPLAGEAPEGRR